MISLKKFLDMDTQTLVTAECAPDHLDPVVAECYRSTLTSMGKNASRVCPGLGTELEASLNGVGRRLTVDPTAKNLKKTDAQVGTLLDEWGKRTESHYKGKADEVKELLIALAKAAESVGNRDKGYSNQFKSLIGNLERIADLDDVTEIRSSIFKRATEMKASVEQMARESQELVAGLRSEVSIYETRLRTAEHLIFKDELTQVANRRSIEERMRGCIEAGEPFWVVMLDLNHFKQVNDRYGHLAGDDLLKQFARELQLNTRSADMVGRWGGDEFILVLSYDEAGVQLQIDRIQDWVFGRYLIQVGNNKKPVEVRLDASIGVADWHPGESIDDVVENADRAMYREKHLSRLKA